jgi:hypothetical protein
MTPEEFLDNCIISNQDKDWMIRNCNIITILKDYAKIMCDKQKEICADKAESKWIADNYCHIDQVCEEINYSPYPTELQST